MTHGALQHGVCMGQFHQWYRKQLKMQYRWHSSQCNKSYHFNHAKLNARWQHNSVTQYHGIPTQFQPDTSNCSI